MIFSGHEDCFVCHDLRWATTSSGNGALAETVVRAGSRYGHQTRFWRFRSHSFLADKDKRSSIGRAPIAQASLHSSCIKAGCISSV